MKKYLITCLAASLVVLVGYDKNVAQIGPSSIGSKEKTTNSAYPDFITASRNLDIPYLTKTAVNDDQFKYHMRWSSCSTGKVMPQKESCLTLSATQPMQPSAMNQDCSSRPPIWPRRSGPRFWQSTPNQRTRRIFTTAIPKLGIPLLPRNTFFHTRLSKSR